MSRVLIIADHDGNHLGSGTSRCVTAAAKFGAAEVHVAVLAAARGEIAAQAAELAGVSKVLVVERAENAVQAADAAFRSAEEALTKSASELETARGAFHARVGERNASKSQLDAMDRTGAESRRSHGHIDVLVGSIWSQSLAVNRTPSSILRATCKRGFLPCLKGPLAETEWPCPSPTTGQIPLLAQVL